jgi:ATP-dependent DNA helicase RecG
MIGFNTDAGIVKKFTEKFTERFTINETQKKTLNLLLANPRITRTDIAEQIGITTRGVQKSIDELKKAGIVERVGAAKGGHWKINEL